MNIVDSQPSLTASKGIKTYRQLGFAALKRRRIKTALRYLRQAQRFDPNYAPGVQALGEVLARQGQIPYAISVLRHAIAIDSTWPWSYYHLAKCYEHQGDLDQALAAYQRTTELAPDFFWGFQDYGEALAKKGHHAAAVHSLERATQLNPQFSWSYHHLGRSLAALGQYDAAVTAYQKAIEYKPDFPWSYYSLGEVLGQSHRYEEARAAYQAAIQLQPNLPGLLDRTTELLVQAAAHRRQLQVRASQPSLLQPGTNHTATTLDPTPQTNHGGDEPIQRQGEIGGYMSIETAMIDWHEAIIACQAALAQTLTLGQQIAVYRLLSQAHQHQGNVRAAITAQEQAYQLAARQSPSEDTHFSEIHGIPSHLLSSLDYTVAGIGLTLADLWMQDNRLAEAAQLYWRFLPSSRRAIPGYGMLVWPTWQRAITALANQPAAATVLARQALILDPQDQRRRFQLAECLSTQQEFASAIPLYRQILRDLQATPDPNAYPNALALHPPSHSHHPDHVTPDVWSCQLAQRRGNLLRRLAAAEIASGQSQSALKTYQQLASLKIEMTQTDYQNWSQAAEAAGDWETARACYTYAHQTFAHQAFPQHIHDNPLPRHSHNPLHAALTNSPPASATKPVTRPLNPMVPNAPFRNDAPETIQDLLNPQLTLSASEGSSIYRRLSFSALKRRQLKTALRYLRCAHQFNPNYAPGVQALGDRLAQQGQTQQAIITLRHAIAVDPHWPWSYYHLAKCYERQGDWQQALAAYQRTTELAPNFFWGFQDYGEALAKQNYHEAAAIALERATQLNPTYSWSYHHLGVSLAALEQYGAAAIAYQKAIEYNPEFPWSHYNLGEVLTKENRYEEARAAYQAAAQLQPNLPGLSERMIDLLVQTATINLTQQTRKGHKQPSDHDIDVAYATVQQQPDDVESWLRLAHLLEQLGQRTRALESYQRVLDLAPNRLEVRHKYDQLLAKPAVEGFPADLLLPPIVGENNDYTFIEQRVQAFLSNGLPYTLPVSLVIPTYNRKKVLAKTLAALVNQTYPRDLIEVVIADDGSTDGVEEVIRRYESYLEIVHVRQSDQGYRLSAVRNLGIRTARHDALIIFDCDILPVPGFVEAYMRYLHVSDRVILTGHRRFVDASSQGEADILADPQLIVNLKDIQTRNHLWTQTNQDTPTLDWRLPFYEKNNYLKREIFPFRFFVGASAAYMRSAIIQAGLYDEEFQAWGHEDIEMGYRLYNEGFYFIPVMDAVGLHQEPPNGENETDREAGNSVTEDLFIQKCSSVHYRPYQPGATYRVPKVSIYIPVYNAERFIREAIDSVLNQTFSDLEVCVVDDGSTDNTLAIIVENYHGNSRVRWQSQSNGGIGKASNAAVRMCRGTYIGQLDADDKLKPDAVETLVNYLDRHNVGCVYGTRELIDAEGNYIGMPYNWPIFSREKLLLSMIVHHFRMFRRRDWMRTDGFAEDLVNAVDYDMFLKLSEVCTLVHIDKVMYSYRMHGCNTSIVDKDAQDRNDLIVVERALVRLGLADQWEVYVPNPDQPRKTAFRRKQVG